MFVCILVISWLVFLAQSVNRYAPVWVTSPYIKADCNNVIAVVTGNYSTPTATIPFPGTAFTSVPNIGYGAFTYQGSDALASEMFQINRTAVTPSSFSVLIQITGITSIRVLNVRFIAIDVNFPHHVTSFDNVPVNYLAGPLANISDWSLRTMQTYTNVINFTLQSGAHPYNKFSTPLSNNKILLFLTSFFHEGRLQAIGETNTSLLNPITFHVDYEILTNQTYAITVNLGVYNKLTRLHYSMIVFDQADVEASGRYMLIYERVNFNYTGAFFHIPQEFVNNFMIGLTNFTSERCRAIIYFSWNFTTINGVFGLEMPFSVTANPNNVGPVFDYGFSYMYIKTWNCPPATFFDPAYNMCSQCPIINCINCFNISVCAVCDFQNGYILNLITGLCQICSLPGCSNCSVSNSTNPPHQYCISCDTQDNYHLVNGTTCQRCLTQFHFFLNLTTMTCQLCSIPDCILCRSLASCQNCDYNNSYGIKPDHTCQYCNNTENVFINLTSKQCVQCSLPNCPTCASLTACSGCDENANYFLNSSTLLCDHCTLSDCSDCFNMTACSVCSPGYLLNSTSLLCEPCTLANCSVCLTLSVCSNCTTGFILNPNTSLCEICTVPNCLTCQSLTACSICDSYAGYFLNTSNLCETCSLSNCLTCLSLTNCSICDEYSGYFLNLTTQLCEPCSLLNCLSCSSLTSCSICNSSVNYFVNATSGLCQPCTLTNCLVCSSLTACSICDNSTGYFLNSTSHFCEPCSLSNCLTCLSLTNCSICDEYSGFFINSTNQLCEPCAVDSCLTCLTLDTCSICDEAADYFLNGTFKCEHCSPTNCFKCQNLTACSVCSPGYLLNSTSLLCEACTLSNCSVCLTLSACSNCTTGFLLNPNTSLCEACTIPNCLNCLTLTACSICDQYSGYFLNTSSLCETCSLSNCLTCLSLTNCSICDEYSGYFLNLTTQLCEPCTLFNCLSCLSLTSCSICNNSVHYFLNSTSGLCQPCALTNCLLCSSLTVCTVCDNSTGYFLNSTSHLCEACSLSNCLTCLSLTNCSICDEYSGFFLNSTNQLCEPCSVLNCLTCLTLDTCSICDEAADYFLNSTFECQHCSLTNCSKCQNLTACSVCDANASAVLNYTSGLCELCSLQGCLICAKIDVCAVCDLNNSYGADFTSFNRSLCGPCNVSCVCDGYTLPWSQPSQHCSSLCGDGLIRVNQQCDDGNTQSYDGCSSSCTIQSYSVCSSEPSICNITLSFSDKFGKIKKEDCNKLSITLDMQNSGVTSNDIEIFHEGITIVEVDTAQNKIKIIAVYSYSLVGQTIIVRVGQEIFHTQISSFQPLLYYSESQCNTAKQLDTLVEAITPISYIALVLSVISCKIIGLELFGILQLAYFSLISYDFLALYMQPITKFKVFNGLNIPIINQPQQPPSLQYLNFSTNILNNCNIMFFLMLAQLILSFLLYLVAKLTLQHKVEKLGLKMLKQGFITLLMFNIFNLSFSAGAHLKFAEYNEDAYVEGIVLIVGAVLLCVLAALVFFFSQQAQYGEFINKFKDTSVCKIYIILCLVFRIAVGVYCSTHSQQTYSTLIILSFSFSLILYCIINLPFKSTAENYRSCLIHITELVILMVANYYRSMKANTPIEIKGYIFVPVLVLFGLIVVCVVLSLARLVYEIYSDLKEFCYKKRVKADLSFNEVGEVSLQTVN